MDIENVIYIHIMEYYSAIKKKVLPFAITWMKLEGITLSEISQTQKDKYCMIHLYEGCRIGKFIDKQSRIVVTRG